VFILRGSDYVHIFYCLCTSVFPLDIDQEGRVAIPLPSLAPLLFGACPESGSGFPTLIDMVLFCGK
jgi:hypothetical protein